MYISCDGIYSKFIWVIAVDIWYGLLYSAPLKLGSQPAWLNWSMLNPTCRYFATLQKELGSYDSVLYEMVASRESLENKRNPAATKRLKSSRSRGFNIIGFIQRQMARILTLDFQLDCLDYQARNFYHADLDFETFKLLQVFFLFHYTRSFRLDFVSLGSVLFAGAWYFKQVLSILARVSS